MHTPMFPRTHQTKFSDKVADELRKKHRLPLSDEISHVYGYEDDDEPLPKAQHRSQEQSEHTIKLEALTRELSLALSAKEIEIETQRADIKSKATQIKGLSEEMVALRTSTEKADAEKLQKEEEHRLEVLGLKQALADRNLELDQLNGRHQHNLRNLMKEVEYVQSIVDQCQNDLDMKTSEIRQLQATVDEGEKLRSKMEDRNQELQRQVYDVEQRCASLLDRVQALQEENACGTVAEIAKLREEVEGQTAKYAELVSSLKPQDLRPQDLLSTTMDSSEPAPAIDTAGLTFHEKIEGLKSFANELRQVARPPLNYEGKAKLAEIRHKLTAAEFAPAGTFQEFLEEYQRQR
ncbi:MAG: uncharacterized protein KVP18_001547 [Porospora cf. gigantea A]|uniref:uncharacterized protein n=2 Tax=Porospora cf. gigantea A TaxID=2853593 RepID=UPI0035593F70|nr:MAG: hypothetical protein KVP18_001547 [Porospora cf. gigantea A]